MQEKITNQNIRALIGLVSLVSICWEASAELVTPEVQLGRYLTVPARPTAAQVALMSTPITVEFPETVRTVSQAIDFVLKDSGFQMASSETGASARSVLNGLPLPGAHRNLGPVTLQQALELLAGPGFQLVIDPVHRLIAFDLSPLARAMSDSAVLQSRDSVLPAADIEQDVDMTVERRR